MSYALTFLLCNARVYLKPLRNGGVDSRTNKTFTLRENLASGKLNRNFTFAPSLRSLQIISAQSSTVTIKMNGRGFSNPDSSYSVTMSSGECARLLSKNEKVRFEPQINLLCTFNNLRAFSFLLKGLDSRNSNEISNNYGLKTENICRFILRFSKARTSKFPKYNDPYLQGIITSISRLRSCYLCSIIYF